MLQRRCQDLIQLTAHTLSCGKHIGKAADILILTAQRQIRKQLFQRHTHMQLVFHIYKLLGHGLLFTIQPTDILPALSQSRFC